MSDLESTVKEVVRDIPDFPKPGIVFKDITPILKQPHLCWNIAESFCESFKGQKVDAVLGIESRGFIISALMSQILNVPLILVRKKGKLPYKTIGYKYELEYGFAEVEVQEGDILPGTNVLIHDDLLATGGTAEAAAILTKQCGANVLGYAFIINLSFLAGQEKLEKYASKFANIATY